MLTEDLQSEIARLKSEINQEENRYFDGIRNNQMINELRNTRQSIERLKYDMEQKIKMLTLL
jgi:hypothetical protein